MTSLALATAALLSGPLLFEMLARRPRLQGWLNQVMSVVVVGLVGLILFHMVGEAGWWSLAFATIGFGAPLVAEHSLHQQALRVHRFTLLFGLAGLALHSLTDGAGLRVSGVEHEVALSWAIIVHRLPIGLAVWWLVKAGINKGSALTALGVMVVATFVGYWIGGHVMAMMDAVARAWFMAFVAGSLLHLGLHRIGRQGHRHAH